MNQVSLVWNLECNVSLELQATVGQSLEFRCDSNETSKFNRITHIPDNGTKEVLLSNDHVNPSFDRSEVTIRKVDHTFLITISPVRPHSAGLYVCDDDTSSSGAKSHINTIRVHVLRNLPLPPLSHLYYLILFNRFRASQSRTDQVEQQS